MENATQILQWRLARSMFVTEFMPPVRPIRWIVVHRRPLLLRGQYPGRPAYALRHRPRPYLHIHWPRPVVSRRVPHHFGERIVSSVPRRRSRGVFDVLQPALTAIVDMDVERETLFIGTVHPCVASHLLTLPLMIAAPPVPFNGRCPKLFPLGTLRLALFPMRFTRRAALSSVRDVEIHTLGVGTRDDRHSFKGMRA